jgi:hypothetical protein
MAGQRDHHAQYAEQAADHPDPGLDILHSRPHESRDATVPSFPAQS